MLILIKSEAEITVFTTDKKVYSCVKEEPVFLFEEGRALEEQFREFCAMVD